MTIDEANGKVLFYYAKRIRELTAKELNTGRLLVTLWLIIRNALKCRAFP
jgi:hypothetical protein